MWRVNCFTDWPDESLFEPPRKLWERNAPPKGGHRRGPKQWHRHQSKGVNDFIESRKTSGFRTERTWEYPSVQGLTVTVAG
jgi:hypothetical protein